jgi:hypothetical protein
MDMDGELNRKEDGGAAASGQAHRGDAAASGQGASSGAANRRRGATWYAPTLGGMSEERERERGSGVGQSGGGTRRATVDCGTETL